MRYHPATAGVDDATMRVSPATGERGAWYLWEDADGHTDASGEYDRLQQSPRIKTDTLLQLENYR